MRLSTTFVKFFALFLVVGICAWSAGCGDPADNGGGSSDAQPNLGAPSDTPDEAGSTPDEAGSTTGGGIDVPDEPADDAPAEGSASTEKPAEGSGSAKK